MDDIDDTLLRVEVGCSLAVVAEAYRRADIEGTAVGSYFTEEHTEEGRLPDAILTDDPDLVMSGEDVVEVLEDDLVAKALADVLCFEDLLPDVAPLSSA